MKFTVLCHAGLLVEHKGKRLVIDPWITGSAYWRSWWNFPEPEPALVENLKPDFVYLTHLHWDHFHGPSLRRFDRNTTILVPKAVTRRMVEDLNWLGFKNVVEIPHGDTFAIGEDFSLCSYQFGYGLDSAAIIQGGGLTLLNANDCKLFGLPLRALLRRFPKIDVVFRSHSSASPIPYCIEDYESKYPTLRSRDDYEEEFARFSVLCGARYAIPFASNHCFLHPETRRFNSTAVTPQAAADRCNALAARLGRPTRAVVMPPGSSFDAQSGFALTQFDYADREPYIDRLLEKHRAPLDRQTAMEADAVGDFAAFELYFQKFRRAIPGLIRRRMGVVTFCLRESKAPRYWSIDFPSGKIWESATEPAETGVVIAIAPNILNDCCSKKMFSVWPASKRLSVRLPKESGMRALGLMFYLLDAYELDLLPLWNNLTARSLGIYLRRWREGVEAASLVLRVVILRKAFNLRDIYPVDGLVATGVET